MNESILIDNTIDILNENDVQIAYDYLKENSDKLDDISSQVYNFLYCLASLCSKNDEALKYLEEAIIDKGFWYRTQVFDDEDLDNIRDDDRFKNCYLISEQRYELANKNSSTVFTWTEKKSENLILALHGNQQNINHSINLWSFLENHGYQVEYIQSSELDSYQLFRWNDDGKGAKQLTKAIQAIKSENYKQKILCGFSSGCNVILNAILNENVKCNTIILQSPWIPMIKSDLSQLIKRLKELDINVLILCGNKDEDCFGLSKQLFNACIKEDINIKNIWINDIGHNVPNNFSKLITNYLHQNT